MINALDFQKASALLQIKMEAYLLMTNGQMMERFSMATTPESFLRAHSIDLIVKGLI